MGKAKKGVYICPNCLNFFEVGEISKWKFIYAKYKENEKVFCCQKCQEEYCWFFYDKINEYHCLFAVGSRYVGVRFQRNVWYLVNIVKYNDMAWFL